MQLEKSSMFLEEGAKIGPMMSMALLKNCIFLPYSYFTLIVKERNNSIDLNEENFLIEGYDYLIDGKNVFHDLVNNSYNSLAVILNCMNKTNYKYVEMLLHPDYTSRESIKETPIHISLRSGNKRIV